MHSGSGCYGHCGVFNQKERRRVVLSKGSKKQFKQFEMKSIEEACLIMRGLLVPVITDIGKYKRYSQEAIELLDKCNAVASIPGEEYDSIHDKLLYQQRELLRFIADNQSSSFSYKMVRPMMEKRGFLKRTLEQDKLEILNELLNLRNLSFHNAQSMTVADLEIAKKSLPQELAGIAEVRPILNPVFISKIESYSKDMLEGFIAHNAIRLKQFETILDEMKTDYQELINALPDESYMITGMGFGREVQYIEQKITELNPDKAGSNIVGLAMGIQKGKYDGTDEAFAKCTNEAGGTRE